MIDLQITGDSMTKKSLDHAVLQAAICARRHMSERDVPDCERQASYELLKSIDVYASVTRYAMRPFVQKMIETSEQEFRRTHHVQLELPYDSN